MSTIKKIRRKTIREIFHIYDPETKTEHLLMKVAGRGWCLSSGGNAHHDIDRARVERWIKEVDDFGDGFHQVKVSHFHY
jgi:hypothetical protein